MDIMGRLYFQEEGESGFLCEARVLIWDSYMRDSIMAVIEARYKDLYSALYKP